MATAEELPNRYFQMSQSLIRQAQEELDGAGDYAQSSEKAWGAVAEALHINFYENRYDRDEVQLRLDRCRELLDELERIRTSPPRRYTPATQEQIRRLERLTRRSPTVTAEEAAIDITALPQV